MDYIFKKYYKNDNYEKTYESRINFEETLKLDFTIKKNPVYFVLNSYTIILMEKIRELDMEIDGYYDGLPMVARESFLDDILVEEIYSSNEIEGVESTREEILKTKKQLDERSYVSGRFSSIIKSYVGLLKADKINTLTDIRFYYDNIIGEEIGLEDKPESKLFRKDDVYIQDNKSFDGSFVHKGESPDLIELQLTKWIDFLNKSSFPLLLRVAICHYIFEYIHPFYDGNGRLGRFLASMYISQSYSYLTSLAVSRGSFIKKNDYYKAFKQTNELINRGELNYFVDEFLKIIIKAQEDMRDILRLNISKLDKILERLDESNDLSAEEVNVLLILAQEYVFSANTGVSRNLMNEALSSSGYHNISRNNRLFDKLMDNGLIQKMKKRPIVYTLSKKMRDYIDINI